MSHTIGLPPEGHGQGAQGAPAQGTAQVAAAQVAAAQVAAAQEQGRPILTFGNLTTRETFAIVGSLISTILLCTGGLIYVLLGVIWGGLQQNLGTEFEKVNVSINALATRLDQRVEATNTLVGTVGQKLDQRIDGVGQRLDQRAEDTNKNLGSLVGRFDGLESTLRTQGGDVASIKAKLEERGRR